MLSFHLNDVMGSLVPCPEVLQTNGLIKRKNHDCREPSLAKINAGPGLFEFGRTKF